MQGNLGLFFKNFNVILLFVGTINAVFPPPTVNVVNGNYLKERYFLMAISKEKKDELIKEYARHDGDTGSPEVQIALLTSDINNLNAHHG